MVDIFEKFVTKNLLEIKHNNFSSDDYKIHIKVSYDMMDDLLHFLIGQNVLCPLEIEVYDENCLPTQKDYLIIQRFLVLINRFNINKISFFLSDTTFPIYCALMQNIKWSNSHKTYIKLLINRGPLNKKKRNLNLPLAPGKLLLSEEILIWQNIDVLNKLRGKVDEQILKDSIILKNYIKDLYAKMEAKYKVEQFTDFDRCLVITNFFKKHFKTIISAPVNNISILDSSSISLCNVVKENGGTIFERARLMALLLNNEFLKTNAFVINGKFNGNTYAWVGVLIDDALYHCCSSYLRPFFSIEDMHCVPDKEEIYPQVYQSQSFSDERYNTSEKRVLSLIRSNSN